MADKATEKKKVVKKDVTVKLFLDGKLRSYSVNEKLPAGFLNFKLKEDQKYIPIHLYRDIMRQIGEFSMPKFVEEKFISGNNKHGAHKTSYKATCTLDWKKGKEVIQLTGIGYSSISAGALLSDAIHGNMHTLYAKSLRDALKYTYNIFEYPEKDVTDDKDKDSQAKLRGQVEKALEKVTKSIDKREEAKKEVEAPVEKREEAKKEEVKKEEPKKDINSEIEKEYNIGKEAAMNVALGEKRGVTKVDILKIATKLKEKFGEENRSLIAKIVTPDVNKAD